jgi:hypothetical protein
VTCRTDRKPDRATRPRAAILERAGNQCEGSPAYTDCRRRNRDPIPTSGKPMILTIAHLDHTPENCDPSNSILL